MNNEIKYIKKGKCTLVEELNNKFIIKEKKENSNIKGLFTYLESRGFNNFPLVIDDRKKDVNKYEYIEDTEYPIPQKATDLIKVVASLHAKTVYFKDVSEDTYKDIYENIISNINYLDTYYNNLYNRFFKERYMAPSHYLFMQNYTKIKSAINFSIKELDSWYEIVKKETSMRVCVVHNDLKIEHYLKKDKEVLVSWDKYVVDTPVLDLFKLYNNDKLKYNFKNILTIYESEFPLTNHEKKLLFVLISIPPKILFDKTEFENTKYLGNNLENVYKTEELIKPYYSENKEKE